MNKNYSKWIDEYAKSFHNGFTKALPISWGPIDAISLTTFLNGTFVTRVYEAITKIKARGYKIEKIAKTFSCPSTIRVALFFLINEYTNSRLKNKQQFKAVVEFIVEILSYLTKRDIFAYERNIGHTDKEISKILKTIKWQPGNTEVAKQLGRLYNTFASLVFALYKDFFPQDSHEIYGPYDASKNFGKNTTFLIKHFPKIKPIQLWPNARNLKYKDVKIFQVYKNVQFQCQVIGMHSIYKGDLINNLLSYAILVNGKYQNDLKQIKKLTEYFAKTATKQSRILSRLSEKELKNKALQWLCYQFFNFFKLAKMDWRPTQEMFEAIKNKKIPSRFELEKFPSFKEYTSSPKYEVYWLKDLYK